MPLGRLLSVLVILLAVLGTLGGCQSAPPGGQANGDAAGGPLPAAASEPAGGLLLRTGAIQLGPGVQRNAWRWQGDGEGGF